MPPKRKTSQKSKKKTSTKRRPKSKRRSTFRNKKKTVSKGEKHRLDHAIHAQNLNTISRGQYIEGIRPPFVGSSRHDVTRNELHPLTAAGLAGWGPANPDQASAAFERKQKRDRKLNELVAEFSREYPDRVKIPAKMKEVSFPKVVDNMMYDEFGEPQYLVDEKGQRIEEFKMPSSHDSAWDNWSDTFPSTTAPGPGTDAPVEEVHWNWDPQAAPMED